MTTRGDVNPALDAFVERIRRLTDEERLHVAEVRAGVAEDFHEAALRAAAERLVGRAEEYAAARRTVAAAHLPEALAGDEVAADDRRRWTDVARLVQLAIDEMLLMLVTSDLLHPDHLRALSLPWAQITRPAAPASR